MVSLRFVACFLLLMAAPIAQAQQSAPPSEATVLRACEVAKNASACSQYGVLLLRGSPTLPTNEAMGLLYLQMGCDRAHAMGCRALGQIAQQGRGVPPNPILARQAYDKGCKLNDGASCMRLGLMMSSGAGGPKDMSEAMLAVRKACEFGEKQACAAGTQTASAPAPAQRRSLTDVEKRACAVQYLGYAEALQIMAMMSQKPNRSNEIELRRRGMTMLGLPESGKVPTDLEPAISSVRGAAMGNDKALQDAALRKMVATMDDCNRAQGLAALAPASP